MREKIVGVTEMQRHFRKVLDEVVEKGTPVILTRGSRPQAVLVTCEQYQKMVEARKDKVMADFDDLLDYMADRNAHFSEEEVAADVEAAIQEVRRERREREKATGEAA